GTYALDNGSVIPPSEGRTSFSFVVDDRGSVTGLSDPQVARASGNRLTLANVRVRVGPTNYTGAYRVADFQNLSGPVEVVLIPGLRAFVGVGDQRGYFTPFPDRVVPPSQFIISAEAKCTFQFSAAAEEPLPPLRFS